MRWMRLVPVLTLLATPALGQPNNGVAAWQAVQSRAQLARVASLANLCQFRSDAWEDRAQELATQDAIEAGKIRSAELTGKPDEVAGGIFALGAVRMALASAAQEFTDFGDAACRSIEHSDLLVVLDHRVETSR